MSTAVRVRCGSSDGTGVIGVASVPSDHVYVRHLTDPTEPTGSDGVVRLADPPSLDGNSTRWWPPAVLDPDWLHEHRDEFDLVHLHFGFDALDPTRLRQIVETTRALDKPLVYTVHDLRNPHHAERSAHDAALDVLIPAADALITLTSGAAAEIERRWGRRAEVLPHPHVVGADRMRRPRPGRTEFRVGLHLKSLRASIATLDAVTALLPLVAELPDLVLRVDVHREVAEPTDRRHQADLMAALSRAAHTDRVELDVHDFFTDDELWDYLQDLDVSVLPYRFGTHSGWLEACHDLGTTVVAPSCGFFAEQRPCLTYRHDDAGLDALSLRASVRRAYTERPSWRADPDERCRERVALAAAHRRIYRSVLT